MFKISTYENINMAENNSFLFKDMPKNINIGIQTIAQAKNLNKLGKAFHDASVGMFAINTHSTSHAIKNLDFDILFIIS